MDKITKYCFLVICLFISFTELRSQAPDGLISYRDQLGDRDTLVITRQNGNWWFGFFGGFNLNQYFSTLKVPEIQEMPVNNANLLLNFEQAGGSGIFFGVTGEYLPINKKWGVTLKAYLYDYRSTISEANPPKFDTLDYKYENELGLTYLSFSLSGRYNFLIEGLHAFAGLDFELPYSIYNRLHLKYKNSGDIAETRLYDIEELGARFGGNIGAGWDIFMLTFNNRVRMRFTPFVSMHMGSAILTDWNSSMNTFQTRLGLAVKFGPDKVKLDTLYYNPYYQEPATLLASADFNKEVIFPGFEPKQPISSNLDYIEKPMIAEEISEKPPSPPEISEEEEKIITKDLVLGKLNTYQYRSREDYEIPEKLKKRLDYYVDILNKNPSFEIRVVGHSDDKGTFASRMQRSRRRADQVKNYFLSKGIARGRILDDARGAFSPIADNRNEAGRRKNRRVDVQIVQ